MLHALFMLYALLTYHRQHGQGMQHVLMWDVGCEICDVALASTYSGVYGGS